METKELFYNNEPKGRRSFAMCNNNTDIYIFGGIDKTDYVINALNDLWELNGMNILNILYLIHYI